MALKLSKVGNRVYGSFNGAANISGVKLIKSQFRDVLDSVEISVNAIFSNQKNQTTLSPEDPFIPSFIPERHPTLSGELLQMYEEDPNSKFIITCNHTNITVI